MSVKNIEELVSQLGGPAMAARVLGTEPHQVQNWKRHGHIPAHFYKLHKQRLEPYAIKVKDSVWSFVTE